MRWRNVLVVPLVAFLTLSMLIALSSMCMPREAHAGQGDVLRVAQAVVNAFPEHEWQNAMRVANCETGGTFDWSVRIIDLNGHVSAGLWQVQPAWWGQVPDTPESQARQVAAIVSEHGWGPWSCRV